MASLSSSTSSPSTEKELISEIVNLSAPSTGQQEMEYNSNNISNPQLNIDVIYDVSHANVSSLSSYDYTQPRDDEYVKSSVPVDDEARIIIEQGHVTENKVIQLIEHTNSQNLTTSNQELSNISGRIIAIDSSIDTCNTQSCDLPSTHHVRPHVDTSATVNNHQQSQKKKHIMMSYNQATASTISKKIYTSLKDRNYNVWIDTEDLHHHILTGMGEAVENSYILIACLNNGYERSDYAPMEIIYARENKIHIIPCIVEEGFRPSGCLGIIKSDLKHIEFFDENKYDESFEKLIDEINYIEKQLGIQSANISPIEVNTCTSTSTTAIVSSSSNDMNFPNRFNAIISEYITSINETPLQRENLNEHEFREFLYKLFQEMSPETLQSFQNNHSSHVDNRQEQENHNDRLIQHLLEQDQRFAEFVRSHQENYDRLHEYLIDCDERLAAFVRFQQKNEENHAHIWQHQLIQDERLTSLLHVQQEQQQDYAILRCQLSDQDEKLRDLYRRQQEQERNDRISEQIQQQIQQFTELIVIQQQQHARHIEAMSQMLNRSLENNELLIRTIDQRQASPTTQQHEEIHSSFNILKKLVQTSILLCTLFVLLRPK